MDQAKRLLKRTPSYEPLTGDDGSGEENGHEGTSAPPPDTRVSYSTIEYAVYMLLGVAMLWAWYVSIPFNTLPSIRS